jgi:hypothetical protein
MLEGSQKINGQNFNIWKQQMLAIFEYRCLDKLILGKEIQSETNEDTLEKYDAKNRKAIMLIKLFVTDEMLPEVQTGDNAFPIWQTLQNLHGTSNKGRLE